jgi:hypothetical protein
MMPVSAAAVKNTKNAVDAMYSFSVYNPFLYLSMETVQIIVSYAFNGANSTAGDGQDKSQIIAN